MKVVKTNLKNDRMHINLKSAGLNNKQKITTIASMDPVFCKDSDTINNVVDKIVSTGHRRIPIVSRRKGVVGIITKSDILDAFLRQEDFDSTVSEIMSRDPILCNNNDALDYVLQKFKLSRRGGFPIVEGKKLTGMVSERDIIKQLLGTNVGIKVEDAMTRKPLIIQQNISILDCLKTMVNTRYRRLPVVSNGQLVGIVTSEDLLKYIHDHKYRIEDLDEGLEKVMIKNVFTVQKDDDVSVAIKIMETKGIGGLPVVSRDKKLEGMITERDILEKIESV